MAALQDTRRVLSEAVKAVDEKIEGNGRELRQQVASQVESLRGDIREVRTGASQTASSLTATRRELAGLGQHVDQLRQDVFGLRELLTELAQELRDRATAPREEAPDAPSKPPALDAASAGDGREETAEAPEPEPRASGAAAGAEDEPATTEQGAPSPGPGSPAADTEETAPHDAAVEASAGQQDETAGHRALLLHTATIANVALVCHRDTWDFIAASAAGAQHFNPTTDVADDGDGRVRVTLSGRSLIGVLIALHTARVDGRTAFDGDWAMACALYQRIADDLCRTRRDGIVPLTIVVDDRTRQDPASVD